MTGGHIAPEVLARYVASGTESAPTEADAVWWAVEVHLERCAACRERVRVAVESSGSRLSAELRRVRGELVAYAAAHPVGRVRRPGRIRRWARWWVTPALLPRLGMTALVVSAAVVLDVADQAAGRFPSLVLLLAPVLPLLGVAAAWSQGLDPAYELVVGSPRAGLDLVLRRAVVAVAAAIGLLAAAGWVVGYSPARWLLPCLAFTVAALALGGFVGVNRAATVLAAAWGVLVVGPSLVVARPPVLLATEAWPGWAVATGVVAVVLVVRRRAFAGLASGR
jgi:hypothetical protein